MIDNENLLGAFLGFEPKSELFFQCGEDGWLCTVRIVAGSYRSELQKKFERTGESGPVKHWPPKHAGKDLCEPLHRNFFIDDRLGRHVHSAASSLRIAFRRPSAIDAWIGSCIRQLQSVLRRKQNIDSAFRAFRCEPSGRICPLAGSASSTKIHRRLGWDGRDGRDIITVWSTHAGPPETFSGQPTPMGNLSGTFVAVKRPATAAPTMGGFLKDSFDGCDFKFRSRCGCLRVGKKKTGDGDQRIDSS